MLMFSLTSNKKKNIGPSSKNNPKPFTREMRPDTPHI